MKKFIFGFVSIIVLGIVVVSLPKQGNKENKQVTDTGEDSIEGDNGFYIETLSDKDICFRADTVLPDNPVINDMMDVANGYAIQNPKDIYAINDFCFLATYDNITRYSEFMFGNSAPLEHMMLFPEILEDADEENEDDGETDG
jgi:hypothetical protein